MTVSTAQRFLTGYSVFDTYRGKPGSIIEANFDTTAVPTLAPLYTGKFFVVEFNDLTRQTFSTEGKRIDHTTGVTLLGVTLLTQLEYTALIGAGYPLT